MKKTKFFLKLLFLFLGVANFAQIKNGSVSYGILTSFKIESNQMEQVKTVFAKIKDAESKVTFTLNFNKKSSFFAPVPSLITEDKSNELACEVMSLKKSFYVNEGESKYQILKSSDIIGDYIMNFEKKADWILSNETKIINGYTCYKATSISSNESGWVDNSKFNITAWYTPKIPVPFGPIGYHGLPGLILEVQNSITTLYVKEISLNLDIEPKINTLDGYKKLTFEEELDIDYKNMPAMKKDILEQTKIEKDKSNEIQKRIDLRKSKENK